MNWIGECGVGRHWRLLGCLVVDYYDGLWHRLDSGIVTTTLTSSAHPNNEFFSYLSIP